MSEDKDCTDCVNYQRDPSWCWRCVSESDRTGKWLPLFEEKRVTQPTTTAKLFRKLPISPLFEEKRVTQPTTPLMLTQDSAERKNLPMARGLLDYFPSALAYVARISKVGNDKHNPGEEMHHARGKSTDHADCIMRHLADRGGFDPESGFLAWRALALLQEELEREEGAPLARGARLP
jgi:hypothetical protein